MYYRLYRHIFLPHFMYQVDNIVLFILHHPYGTTQTVPLAVLKYLSFDFWFYSELLCIISITCVFNSTTINAASLRINNSARQSMFRSGRTEPSHLDVVPDHSHDNRVFISSSYTMNRPEGSDARPDVLHRTRRSTVAQQLVSLLESVEDRTHNTWSHYVSIINRVV